MNDESENEIKVPKTNKKGGTPVLTNNQVGVAAWINEDKNGNAYLSVKLGVLETSVNLFVNNDNRFQDYLNSYLKEKKG